jgi:hypothetical protein
MQGEEDKISEFPMTWEGFKDNKVGGAFLLEAGSCQFLENVEVEKFGKYSPRSAPIFITLLFEAHKEMCGGT